MGGADERLKLFEADLLKPGSFDAAFRGAHVVIHSAMPVLMQAKDPQRMIVDPALRGVDNVLSAVECNTASVARLVFTSSTECIKTVAADSPVLTEEHYNDEVRDSLLVLVCATCDALRPVLAVFLLRCAPPVFFARCFFLMHCVTHIAMQVNISNPYCYAKGERGSSPHAVSSRGAG
jgi:hypothetical protein